MESLSPFAGCRTEPEIRAQLDALNRLAYGVAQTLSDAPPREAPITNYSGTPWGDPAIATALARKIAMLAVVERMVG